MSRSLEQATGLAPSQVSERDVCPAARATQARCAAQVLVLRSDGALVRPHVDARASLGRVRAASRLGFAMPAAGDSSEPPQVGTPAFLEQAYDLSYLSQTGGVGDTVAIVDAYDDPGAQADLNTYRSAYGLPPCTTSNACFKQVNQNGGDAPLPAWDPNWEAEESLDLDAVSALCPNCHILLVEADSPLVSDLQTAMATAASMGANQISASWTLTSSEVPSGTYTFPRVATVAASGDYGYLGPGLDSYPAAFPGVTAAGGTSLVPATAAANARGFSEAAWSLNGGYGGGSGCDLQVAKPAYQTDSGCPGRSYADLSADADPSTGLIVYDAGNGGWILIGGTSLAAPLIASYYAIARAPASSPGWAYSHSGRLNDLVTGSTGSCASAILYICNAGVGYDGPTGVGSISGAVVTGAPGIGGPAIDSGSSNTYTQSTSSHGATIAGGIYRNGRDTSWWIEYGASTAYGNQTASTDIGSGTSPVAVTGYLSGLAPSTTYHYRLVAQNTLGTTYGYDYALTTAAASPTDPTASFTASPTLDAPNAWASFDASGSTDPEGTITDYSWNFGDGATADTATTPTVSHSYATRGSYNVTLTITNNDGQTDTTTQTVRVDDPPSAALTPSATLTIPGSAVSFDGTASAPGAGGTITDYSWNFGDGTTIDTGITATASHTYTAPGVYTVKLTTSDDLGVSDKAAEVITVDQPAAAFTTPPAALAPGDPASFDATGSTDPEGTITDYSWNFGDGTTDDTGTTPTASHTYTTRDHYNVTLTVTNSNGQTASSTETVTVDDRPTAALTPSTSLATPGSAVSFDGTASAPGAGGAITDYSWNFGDASTQDTGTTPTTNHTYTTPGVYTARLTATDDLGVSDTATTVITVDQPTATFTSDPNVPTPEAPASFDTSGSTDPEGTITDYSWDFGDGTTIDTGITATASHTYTTRGNYDVTVTITNSNGQTATSSETVTIDDPPTAALTPSATLTTPGSEVSFDGTVSAPGAGGTITDYRWDFGDGTTQDTGTTPTADHTYTTPGIYTARLTTTDDLGLTDTASRQVTVDAPPTASFTASPNPSILGSLTSFSADRSSDANGTIADYSWNFGDGSTGSGRGTSHVFGAPGNYNVVLTVTNDAGQTATSTETVTVESPPAAVLPASQTPAPDPPTFTPPLQPLSGRLTTPKRLKLASVIKHGLRLTVSLDQSGEASFQITIPPRASKQTGTPAAHRRPTLNLPAITLLRVRGRAVGPGTHLLTLKLSRAAARHLAGHDTIALTVWITVIDRYGRVISRSATVRLHR